MNELLKAHAAIAATRPGRAVSLQIVIGNYEVTEPEPEINFYVNAEDERMHFTQIASGKTLAEVMAKCGAKQEPEATYPPMRVEDVATEMEDTEDEDPNSYRGGNNSREEWQEREYRAELKGDAMRDTGGFDE